MCVFHQETSKFGEQCKVKNKHSNLIIPSTVVICKGHLVATMISAVSSDSRTVVELNKKHAVLFPSSFTNFLITEDSLNVMFYGVALHNLCKLFVVRRRRQQEYVLGHLVNGKNYLVSSWRARIKKVTVTLFKHAPCKM